MVPRYSSTIEENVLSDISLASYVSVRWLTSIRIDDRDLQIQADDYLLRHKHFQYPIRFRNITKLKQTYQNGNNFEAPEQVMTSALFSY